MPALLDPRRERFARLVVKTGNQRRSYVAAGYRCKSLEVVDACASRLQSSAKVKARIEELQMRIQRRADVNEDTMIAEFVDMKERAVNFGQMSAAVQALTRIGQIAGLFVDRKEVGAPGDFSRERNKQTLFDALIKRLGPEQASAIMNALVPKPMIEANTIGSYEPNSQMPALADAATDLVRALEQGSEESGSEQDEQNSID